MFHRGGSLDLAAALRRLAAGLGQALRGGTQVSAKPCGAEIETPPDAVLYFCQWLC